MQLMTDDIRFFGVSFRPPLAPAPRYSRSSGPAAIPMVPRLISNSRLVGAVIVTLGVVVTAFSNSERSQRIP